MASSMVYPDSLVLLWENKVIFGGQNDNLQISGDIKSVVCEVIRGDNTETPLGFVELFRSGRDTFDGMRTYMVDADIVSFDQYQLMIPTYPDAAAEPTWNICRGFIKGTGPVSGSSNIYRIYAGRRVDEGASALDSA